MKPDFIPPAKLTEIGEEAFAGVAATAVKLGENVSSIGSRAFADCPNLSAIYIPAATKSIDESAFADDGMLATIVGKSGSAAEAFAKDNGYEFVIGP